MDQDVPVGMFKCNYCGSVHETPAVAKAVPMRFWCSTDCWEKIMQKTLILDIETTELRNSQTSSIERIWMIGTMDLETKTKKSFLTPSFSDATEIQEYINGYSTVVGHNIIGFDSPVMNDLLGITLPNVVDTLVLSRLYNPQMEGGHSLRAWGERLGFRKEITTTGLPCRMR